VVIDAKVFSRRGVDKDDRSMKIEEMEIEGLNRDREDELAALKRGVRYALSEIMAGRTVKKDIKDRKGEIIVKVGKKLTHEALDRIEFHKLRDIDFSNRKEFADRIDEIFTGIPRNRLEMVALSATDGIVRTGCKKGDDLPPGVGEDGQGVCGHQT